MKSLSIVLVFAVAACSQSPTSPSALLAAMQRDSIMFHIVNTTDSTWEVRGIPGLRSAIPQPSLGVDVFGAMVAPGSSCIALWAARVMTVVEVPDGDTVTASGIVGPHPAGRPDTIWSTADSLEVQRGFTSNGGTSWAVVESTAPFVPGTSRGWDITFSGSGAVVAIPAEPCTH